jgi:hypothetical protein
MKASPNSTLSESLQRCFTAERLGAYRADGADEQTALARYLLNMALSEALYPVLQFAEVALRNSMHQALSLRFETDNWYDAEKMPLTPWQAETIGKAKDALKNGNRIPTSGQIVAELNFGFWTGFFNKAHARTGMGHYLAKAVFSHAPKAERDAAKQDLYWGRIRRLRNRIFHHERILHWKNLDEQHGEILSLITWIDPNLKDLVASMDRYLPLRSGGLGYWRQQSESLLSNKAPKNSATSGWLETDAAKEFDGEESPFGGPRWTSGTTNLTPEALTALAQGKYIACDVRQEYIHYLKLATSSAR